MALLATANAELYDTENFLVESAEGPVGRVEEVWLDSQDEPQALAVRTVDGKRALLLSDEIRTVDRQYHWVVVRPHPTLLELDAPRLDSTEGGGELQFAALWATTGTRLSTPPPNRLTWLLRGAAPTKKLRRGERPVWKAVAILYGCVALAALLLTALAFLIPLLVSGRAY